MYSDDFPDPVSSGFGTWHTLTPAPNAGDTSYQIVQDIYDESDISGFNNTVSKANDFDNEILPHYDTRGNVSTFSALASSFSRSAAVSYADAYVGNYSFSSGMLQIILTIINNIKTLMHRAATVRTMCRSA